jgi:polyhydroxyalkanoate synthase subunit PhaC
VVVGPRADADRASLLVDAINLSTEAAEALAPETELIARADVSGVGDALRHVAVGCVRNPGSTLQAIRRFSLGMASAGVAATARATGRSIDPVLATDAKDRRFADPAWTGNAAFFGLQQAYLLWVRLMDDLVAAATLDGTVAAKAQFVVRAIADALAPTNTLPGNPAALRRAFDTGGISSSAGRGTCSTTSGTTAACLSKWTARASWWARTSPPPRDRWCSATTSWN